MWTKLGIRQRSARGLYLLCSVNHAQAAEDGPDFPSPPEWIDPASSPTLRGPFALSPSAGLEVYDVEHI